MYKNDFHRLGYSVSKESLLEMQIRLLELCYLHSRNHLGSSFSTLPILFEIYSEADLNDRIILSNGHAASALYVVLEKFRGMDADWLLKNMGDHPARDMEKHIHCSTGSLGMGITVATGMALADPSRKVFCVVSDGECAEGSVWEALLFLRKMKLKNIEIFVNLNGWAGYDSVDVSSLETDLKSIYPRIKVRKNSIFPFEEEGLRAHYLKLDNELFLKKKEKLCAKNL